MTRTVTHRFLYLIFLISVFPSINHAQTNFWKLTNGPYGGPVKIVAVNANILLLLSYSGDLFLSRDTGKNWTKINSPFSKTDTFFIEALCVTKNDVIFLGGQSRGFYRSTDFGYAWELVKIDADIVRQISFGPPNILIATTEKGIYKSENNASNWSLMDTTTHYGRYRGIRLDNQENIYAWLYENPTYEWPNGKTTIKRLAKNSSSWEELSPIGSTYTGSVTVLDIVSKENGFLFVATAYFGIFRSEDHGKTWIPINTGLPTLIIRSIAVLPSGTLLVGLYYNLSRPSLFRSTDEGKSWLSADTIFSKNTTTESIVVAPHGQSFVGNSISGLLSSTDDGNSWNQKEFSLAIPKSIAVCPDNELIVSMDRQAIFTSRNSGDSWSIIGDDPFGFPAILYCSSSGVLFNADRTTLMRFERGERQYWKYLSFDSKGTSPLAIAANGDLYLVSYGWGARRSTNNGDTWLPVPTDYTPSRFVADPSGPVYMYTSGGDFRTTDNGSHWQTVTIPAFANIVNTSNGLKVAATNTGVQVSNDSGLTWTPLSLTGHNVYLLFANWKGHFFAVADSGIFRSFDKCASWESIKYNLPSLNITTAYLTQDGFLYVGLQEGGIYRTVESTVTSVSEPQGSVEHTFTLSQNYPNPFNPSTQIQYSVPSRQHFKITMYDVLGRLVETLVDEIKEQGSYTITWNPTNLPSGVYLYRLESASYSETRKLVLLR